VVDTSGWAEKPDGDSDGGAVTQAEARQASPAAAIPRIQSEIVPAFIARSPLRERTLHRPRDKREALRAGH